MVEAASSGTDRGIRGVLALCARPTVDRAGYDQLGQYLGGLTDWRSVEVAAEAHGLGPLVYSHLDAVNADLPRSARRTFHGLYLRHCHQNSLRLRALRDVLVALDSAGISALVLKGAALAHLIYPRPGLRPMGDLDLLVNRSDLRSAERVLAEMDFIAPLPLGGPLPDKHLVVTKNVDGLPVKLDLHHRLFPVQREDPPSTENRSWSPVPFALEGLTAYTLDLDVLLWHLCQHLVFHADVFTRLRLIWVADIARLAESFLDRFDWGHVLREYPIVRNVLSVLQAVVPLSERLRAAAKLPAIRAERGGWADFQGWPRYAVGDQRRQGKETWDIFVETFLPAVWWLRLHYGLDSGSPLWWYQWVRHPVDILGWCAHLLRQRGTSHAVRG